MPIPQLVVWFNEDDYESIKGLAPNDPTLPDTFEDWSKQMVDEIAKLKALNTPFVKVVVLADELAAYCEASGLDHNATTRGAYAVYVNERGGFKNR